MQAALPALIAFSRRQALERLQRDKQQQQQQQQHHNPFHDNDNVETCYPDLFQRRRAFRRSLPRGSRLFASSAVRSDMHLSVEDCIPGCDDGVMAIFQDAFAAQSCVPNIYVQCVQTPASRPASVELVASPSSSPSATHHASRRQSASAMPSQSQIFCYLRYTLPLIAACGHLGSRPTSSGNTLKYCT